MVNKVENIITVINYIENNLTEKLNLSSIAMGVGYSKYHLHRMFVETVGLSIHDYVQRRQLTESAKLLVFSDNLFLKSRLLLVMKVSRHLQIFLSRCIRKRLTNIE